MLIIYRPGQRNEKRTTASKVKKKDSNVKMSKMINTNLTMEDESFPNFFWRVYKGSVSAMKLIKIPKEYIVVGAENKHVISIFSLLGKIHCLYNLEFPLPTLWQLSVSSFEKRKQQYETALEMIKKIDEYNKREEIESSRK
jgi:hypothetical protein